MGKRTNKRANVKIKCAGTRESVGGSCGKRSLPSFLAFFFFRFALHACFLLSLSLHYLGAWDRLQVKRKDDSSTRVILVAVRLTLLFELRTHLILA